MLERIKSTSEVEVPFCQPCCTPSGRTSPLWPPYITGHTQHQGFISLKRQKTPDALSPGKQHPQPDLVSLLY